MPNYKYIDIVVNDKTIDELLKGLKEHALGLGLEEVYLKEILPPINNVVKQIINEEIKFKNPYDREKYLQFSYKEYTRPEFYQILDGNIFKVARIHSTTSERFADFILDFFQEKSDNAYNLTIPPSYDPEFELKAIQEYIVKNWDGLDKFDHEAFFKDAWSQLLDLKKNYYDSLGSSFLLNFIKQWEGERLNADRWAHNGVTFKDEEIKRLRFEDPICCFVKNLLTGSMNVSDIFRDYSSFSDELDPILKDLRTKYPEAKKVKPKGWKAFAKDYSDYDGMEEFDEAAARKEFKGFDPHSAGALPFHVATSLPHTMYSDVGQGRKPLETLVGSMFTQAIYLSMYNNIHGIAKELLELKKEYSDPKYFQKLDYEFKPEFKHPLNKAFYIIHLDDEEKLNARIEEDKKNPKPPVDAKQQIADMLANIGKPLSKEDSDRIEKEREDTASKVLSVLGLEGKVNRRKKYRM